MKSRVRQALSVYDQPMRKRGAAPSRPWTQRSQGALVNATMGTLLTCGEELPSETRAEMEARFGQDFRQVRVHSGADAAEFAASLGANAFSIGPDIVFGAGHYDPNSDAGVRLLAHELAHVVQQSRGGLAPSLVEDTLEAGADRAAASVAEGSGPVQVSGASGIGVARQATPFSGLSQTGKYPHTVKFRDENEFVHSDAGAPFVYNDDGTITATVWRSYPASALVPSQPAPPLKSIAKTPSRPPKLPDPPVDARRLREIAEALRPRLTYPKPVRHFIGGLQFVGGALEAGFGGVGGLATAETGAGLAAGGFLLLHGADTASSGWHTMWTGEQSQTYTFRLGAGAATAAGADPKLASAVGQSTDLIANIGSAGLSLAVVPSPAIALTPEAEMELELLQLTRLETGQARSAGAAGLNDWSVFTPPGAWRVIRRPASTPIEAQALWSGQPYRYSGNNLLVLEYHAGGLDFDRAAFDELGSLEAFQEFKWTYAGSIARGDANVAERLRAQAANQLRIADEFGVPLEWHVPADELQMFQNALGSRLSRPIIWVPYARPLVLF